MQQSLKDSPALLAMMSRTVEGASGQYPVFDQSPLYLRRTLKPPSSPPASGQTVAVSAKRA